MERNTKQLLAVFSLMLGLSWGIPYLVSEEKNSSWLMLSIIFLVLALLFWFWIMREQRTAEEAANDALDAAEDNIKKLEAQTDDGTSSVSASSAGSVPVADASADVDTSDDDEDVGEKTKAEELVDSPSTPEEIEDVAEEAKSGDPVAETTVSEVSAAPETKAEAEIEVEESTLDSDHDTAEDETAISVDISELEAEEEAEIANDAPAEAEELAEEAVSDSGEIDLTIIEGIGPKYSEILVSAGVDTFAKLAAMTTDEIVELVKANGGRKAGSMPTWAEQAKLAAAGDWDALEKLQDELTGGRR